MALTCLCSVDDAIENIRLRYINALNNRNKLQAEVLEQVLVKASTLVNIIKVFELASEDNTAYCTELCELLNC